MCFAYSEHLLIKLTSRFYIVYMCVCVRYIINSNNLVEISDS